MAKSFNNGKIAVRPRQGKIHTSQLDKDRIFGYNETYLHSEASRSTEDDALSSLDIGSVPELNELQREIALLERIGRDPEFMKDYPTRDRYTIGLYGSALWAWIGRQPGITMRAKEVAKQLDEISRIQKLRADAGLDSDKIGE